jgi:putative transposase
MYEWRKMTEAQRLEVLKLRQQCRVPFHSPPHYGADGWNRYHLSAANYGHVPIIGKTPERLAAFSAALCDALSADGCGLLAWCVLPNHWHALVGTEKPEAVLAGVSRLHGRSSFEWNGEDDARGRQCWHCCADRRIRSEAHFYAARNYVHHNPVKHGYVNKWDEWPFSSARDFVNEAGRDLAEKLWRDYPVLDMGKTWDD